MEQTNQYLTFVLREEVYAIPVINIREVLVIPRLTRIPRMPQYMRGIINLRGAVVPVLDLCLKFGLGETEQDISNAIIVIEIPVRTNDETDLLHVGLLVDAVQKVITIDEQHIEPAPRIGTTVNTNFILGMGHVGENFLVILNIREILTAEETRILESADVTDTEPA